MRPPEGNRCREELGHLGIYRGDVPDRRQISGGSVHRSPLSFSDRWSHHQAYGLRQIDQRQPLDREGVLMDQTMQRTAPVQAVGGPRRWVPFLAST